MGQTIVVKIGTSTLTDSKTGNLALSTIASLVETLTYLRREGNRVILVSSGAVGIGCARLGIRERPRNLHLKQAIAAVGQGRLIRVYDDLFSQLGQSIAQILLTRRDFVDRNSYVNAFNTLNTLLEMGVIPIVNENDTTATDELKFGDNDTLSALVASLVEADWLFLLTDIDRLYSADPRLVPWAKPIDVVDIEQVDELEIEAGDSGTGWGTGGMKTKLKAVKIAASAGVTTVITHGKNPENIVRILQGEEIGTRFTALPKTENARKRWIANGLISMGRIYIDEGAVEAICRQGKSLLPAGVVAVEGKFNSSEAVDLVDSEGRIIGKGISNYSHHELLQIKGKKSAHIGRILGYQAPQTVIHRDNLVIFD
ncbi:MAG: glutamate 5-kinase [Geminocystis sp.]|nr:glutamate 5-kinase [Geminocystis sp.]